MSTKIEWTDETWSPIRVRVREDAAAIAEAKGYASLVPIAAKMAGRVGQHCEHVSPGCLHCYAETNSHRCLPGNGTGLPYERRSRDLVEAFVDEKVLLKPLGWKPVREIRADAGGNEVETSRVRRIFVENQSDIFGEWVTDEMLDRVFAVMALCPQHTFQVLTKRPERMLAYLSELVGGKRKVAIRCAEITSGLPSESEERAFDEAHSAALAIMDRWSPGPLPNVWLGVSVDRQPEADARIPLLLQTPAAVRYISAEPLLGPVDIEPFLSDGEPDIGGMEFRCIDWVICGGESGAGARPMHPDWARGLRDQCTAAGVPFFFKQWGEWTSGENVDRTRGTVETADWFDGKWTFGRENLANDEGHIDDEPDVYRVGKKAAGRLLDGREWSEFPDAGVKA